MVIEKLENVPVITSHAVTDVDMFMWRRKTEGGECGGGGGVDESGFES